MAIRVSVNCSKVKMQTLKQILTKIGFQLQEKLLGVTLDNQLNFNHHISKICKTASKLHALARVSL